MASTEYAALVFLVGLVLSAAAVAVAAPGLPQAVVAKLRHGVCIAGGDVCTPADARRRGLGPCPLEEVARDRDAGPTVLFVRIGGRNGTSIVKRSDGTFEYSQYRGGSVDAATGLGVQAGPVVRVGGSGSTGFAFRAGRAWELSDEAALVDFDRRRDKPDAPIRYEEGTFRAQLQASFGAGDGERSSSLGSVTAELRQVLGRRRGPDGTTWYVSHGGSGGADLSRSVELFDAGAQRLVEWHEGSPPSITVRESTASHGRVVEKIARLSLADPADRAAARRWALVQLSPALAAVAAGDFGRRLRERGTLERHTFAEEREADGWNVSARLGVSLGADHGTVLVHRRLVGAEVLGGPVRATREDCFLRH